MPSQSTFLRLTDSAHLPAKLRGAVVAIGNFDGVHQGHKTVLTTALAEAHQTKRPALVLTFEPHPREVFDPQNPVYRLTSATQKAAIFQKMGFDGVIEQHFTKAFAALSAEDFADKILKKNLNVSCVVAGANFHFGHKRQGTPAYLHQAGKDFGFKVILIERLKCHKKEFVSSSRIRTLLAEGRIEQANHLLGRIYSVNGKIIRGQQLGRTLGFPTANIALPSQTALKFGIYAVLFRLDNVFYQGVASFGRRPTVEIKGEPLLEIFIFDFNADIYGKQAEILFISFLRSETKFTDLKTMTIQMQKDVAAAKAVLAQTQLPT